MSDSAARILLIDDEADLVEVWSLWLQSRGYIVDSSSDAAEGFSQAIADPPQLILLDVAMPQIDGWTLCQQLRQDETTRDVPVIIMTALATPDVEDRAQAVGASSLITKPFSEESLLSLIDHFLQQ